MIGHRHTSTDSTNSRMDHARHGLNSTDAAMDGIWDPSMHLHSMARCMRHRRSWTSWQYTHPNLLRAHLLLRFMHMR